MFPPGSRVRYGQQAAFLVFYISGACHLPFSILCSLFLGARSPLVVVPTCQQPAGMSTSQTVHKQWKQGYLRRTGTFGGSSTCSLSSAAQVAILCIICAHACWVPGKISSKPQLCLVPVLRGAAIGWSYLSARAWSLYMAALVLDYTYCISSTMVQRRVKDIPRRELVWDIAGICAGVRVPCMQQHDTDSFCPESGSDPEPVMGAMQGTPFR